MYVDSRADLSLPRPCPGQNLSVAIANFSFLYSIRGLEGINLVAADIVEVAPHYEQVFPGLATMHKC